MSAKQIVSIAGGGASSSSSVERGTYASRPTAADAEDVLYICTDVPFAYFSDGVSWYQHYMPSIPAAGPLADWDGATFNVRGTESTAATGDSITFTTTSTSTSTLRGWVKGSLNGASNWTVTGAFMVLGNGNGLQYPGGCIFARQSGTDEIYTAELFAIQGRLAKAGSYWLNSTTRLTNTEGDVQASYAVMWARLRKIGSGASDIKVDFSIDGKNWENYASLDASIVTADQYGFALQPWGQACSATLFSLEAS